MARRRKIPVRKHHGVRDPLKQLEEKEKRLKNFVNSPPDKNNDQTPSYKFMQFKKLSDQSSAGKKIKRLHSGVEDKPKDFITRKRNGPAATNETRKYKNIKQLPGEEDGDYLRRVNRITTASLKEAQYEAKYGVKVVRNPQTGAITVQKQPTNEIDELLKQKRKELKGGKNKKTKQEKNIKPIDSKLAKQLIKQAIAEDEDEKRQEKASNMLEYQRDDFKFGETVHAPPSILALPRRAEKNETVPRPGKKNNLLLKSLLNKNDPSSESAATKKSKKTNSASATVTKLQMKGKRKDLPEHVRIMLEAERKKFVELYRNLKKSKGVQANKS